jgi:acetyl esterase/lipase
MKAATLRDISFKPAFQFLICPVIDNTATEFTSWTESSHASWLTPSRMKWYRDMYLSQPDDARQWDASPCFAPKEMLKLSPKTLICIAECDLLAPEEHKFAELLQSEGVVTEKKIYKGATHSILVLAG